MTATLHFPNDDNGEVLRRMHQSGDDLSKARDIDFTVVLPSKSAAQAFGDHFHNLGYRVSAEDARTVAALPWDVVVIKHMVPTHSGIADFETVLQNVAVPLGG